MSGEVAVMQGRLSPPEDSRVQAFPAQSWRQEFESAAAAGVDAIEWIYEDYRHSENPLASDTGVREMRGLSAQWGVAIPSVCADFLMDQPLVRGPQATVARSCERMLWLLERVETLGATRVVLPFVAANEIRTSAEHTACAAIVRRWAAAASPRGIACHVEMSLPPTDLVAFLDAVAAENVRVTYDTGNSVIFGFDAAAELKSYGSSIGSVHVKDALFKQHSVPLGTGDARIRECFETLRSIGYQGPYVLQAARVAGEPETATVRRDAMFVRALMSQLTPDGLTAS